jgi:urea-proton symporter
MLLAFCFTVYGTSDLIGSPRRMAELLALQPPVEGNAGGSYLTFRSLPGLQFGIINICGNFAAVFADQAYFQRGIASSPEEAVPAFILGGLTWTAVPLTMATSLGLAARALMGQTPKMANLTAEQISEGLSAPAAAVALMGKSGAAAMLVTLL